MQRRQGAEGPTTKPRQTPVQGSSTSNRAHECVASAHLRSHYTTAGLTVASCIALRWPRGVSGGRAGAPRVAPAEVRRGRGCCGDAVWAAGGGAGRTRTALLAVAPSNGVELSAVTHAVGVSGAPWSKLRRGHSEAAGQQRSCRITVASSSLAVPVPLLRPPPLDGRRISESAVVLLLRRPAGRAADRVDRAGESTSVSLKGQLSSEGSSRLATCIHDNSLQRCTLPNRVSQPSSTHPSGSTAEAASTARCLCCSARSRTSRSSRSCSMVLGPGPLPATPPPPPPEPDLRLFPFPYPLSLPLLLPFRPFPSLRSLPDLPRRPRRPSLSLSLSLPLLLRCRRRLPFLPSSFPLCLLLRFLLLLLLLLPTLSPPGDLLRPRPGDPECQRRRLRLRCRRRPPLSPSPSPSLLLVLLLL